MLVSVSLGSHKRFGMMGKGKVEAARGMGRLTSLQMDMTSTMGRLSASLRASKPPTSVKRSRSSKATGAASQNSGLMVLDSAGMPSTLGTGTSMVELPWMKTWERLSVSKRVMTLFAVSQRHPHECCGSERGGLT